MHIVGTGSSTGGGENEKKKSSVRERIEAQFVRHASLLQKYNPQADREYAGVPCAILHCTRSMDTEKLCGVSYPWLSNEEFRSKSVDGWGRLFGRRLLVLDIDCNHFEVFGAANIADVSTKLEWACAILEGQ
ncbi:hypothetical protein B0T17DRAFT_541529 [Bombardia bombarda]|uniref:Uncharacterized protein n=1 Tax=Bombardia bombarda TaxID=252184 RepID=A0AA39WH30_9PEZI|nr:hypothetical protein B0T17DRAFT_541529 [Bombardia bombarda]